MKIYNKKGQIQNKIYQNFLILKFLKEKNMLAPTESFFLFVVPLSFSIKILPKIAINKALLVRAHLYQCTTTHKRRGRRRRRRRRRKKERERARGL